MDNRNDPAYPCKRMEHVPEYHSQDVKVWGPVDYHGITKRELFAAMSMQGILSAGNGWPDRTLFKEIAHRAVIQADALLASLNAEESK